MVQTGQPTRLHIKRTPAVPALQELSPLDGADHRDVGLVGHADEPACAGSGLAISGAVEHMVTCRGRPVTVVEVRVRGGTGDAAPTAGLPS